ncbi:MAG TPA: hypothetical protein VM261_23510 [Kofleriaceae bacterium]|nr:hypothetical protein [Kofleriaceae bacterium]
MSTMVALHPPSWRRPGDEVGYERARPYVIAGAGLPVISEENVT